MVAKHVSPVWRQGLGALVHNFHTAAPGLQSRLQLPAQPGLQGWPLPFACTVMTGLELPIPRYQ